MEKSIPKISTATRWITAFIQSFYEMGRNKAVHQVIQGIRDRRFVQRENADGENDSVWLATIPQHFQLAEAILILILRRLWQLLMKSWSMDLVCSIIPDRNSWTGVLYRKCAGFRQNRLPEQILEKQQVIKNRQEPI